MAADLQLRLHHLEPLSNSNGPGQRVVIWLQGCTLACPGCFNPLTHPRDGGTTLSTKDLAKNILQLPAPIEGITLSGGEPLQQLPAITGFLEEIHRRTNLSVVLFSGYTWDEISKLPSADKLLKHIDILLAGRYVQEKRIASSLVGSANKTVHFLTSRYSPADLLNLPEAEIIIHSDGSLHLSGIQPIQW